MIVYLCIGLYVVACGLGLWVIVLRSRLRTAIADIRYWRADSDMWRAKVGQLTDLWRRERRGEPAPLQVHEPGSVAVEVMRHTNPPVVVFTSR